NPTLVTLSGLEPDDITGGVADEDREAVARAADNAEQLQRRPFRLRGRRRRWRWRFGRFHRRGSNDRGWRGARGGGKRARAGGRVAVKDLSGIPQSGLPVTAGSGAGAIGSMPRRGAPGVATESSRGSKRGGLFAARPTLTAKVLANTTMALSRGELIICCLPR